MELTREPEITILGDDDVGPTVGLSSAAARDARFTDAVRSAAGRVAQAYDPDCDVSIVEVSELVEPRRGERVLVVASTPSDADVRRAVELGAAGVIDRTADRTEVAAAIGAVAAGLTVVPRQLAPMLLARLADPPAGLALESADLELLQDVASGMTLDEVALVRDRSTRTIRRELRDLWRRMGVSGRAPGLVLAARWGLVD